MKSNGTLTGLLTVLVAALIGFAPMASGAAENKSELSGLTANSGSAPKECSLDRSASPTGCEAAGTDQTALNTTLVQAVEGDYQLIDGSGALLEELIKAGPDRYEEIL